ncbi:MAG: hypothetical protein J1F35_06695 [Erysipelotrichales bacterium]|nr:hypothetical protein [Erysipelotrichales bacterium]
MKSLVQFIAEAKNIELTLIEFLDKLSSSLNCHIKEIQNEKDIEKILNSCNDVVLYDGKKYIDDKDRVKYLLDRLNDNIKINEKIDEPDEDTNGVTMYECYFEDNTHLDIVVDNPIRNLK